MPPIDRIVDLTITANTQTTPRRGFGTPLLAAYHTLAAWGSERVRGYSALSEAVSDGFTAGTPIYRALAAMFGQSPRPKIVKVGRRALPVTQVVRWTPIFTDATGHEGFVYSLTFTNADGTEETATYTVANSDTVALIIDGMKIAIDALGVFASTTDNTTSLDMTCAAGVLIDIKDDKFKSGEGNSTLKNTSANPGIATDLAAILAADDDWYGLALDSNSEAEVLAAEAWAEANQVQFGWGTSDSECYDSGVSNDVMSDSETAAYKRSFGLFGASVHSNVGAAAVARRSPFTPGEFNLYLKTLSGQSAVSLSTTRQTNILAKTGNVYVLLAGQNGIQDAKAFDGNFIDLQPLLDYLYVNIQANALDVIRTPNILPFTDTSISAIKAAVRAALGEREGKGILKGSITVTAPLAAEVSAANKSNRILPDVFFQATVEGAIHRVVINGVLSL